MARYVVFHIGQKRRGLYEDIQHQYRYQRGVQEPVERPVFVRGRFRVSYIHVL